jgi:uncharacterized protein (DUF1501 family)
MNRRVFIKNTALATVFPYFLGALSSCGVKSGKRKPIFVLIQMIGGNDGLNTLIPLDQYPNLSKARPNLIIPENKVLSLKGISATGLHPSMEGVRDLYNNKLVSFIQGVGYENPNYSHFRSSDILLTGSGSSETLYSGWMARYLETRFKKYPEGFPNQAHPDPPAIKIGDTGSFLFEGYKMDMSIVIDPYKSFESPEIEYSNNKSDSYAAIEVNSIREILLQTKSYAGIIGKALKNSFAHTKSYPKSGENPLADQLKMVAKLINSGLQTSVYLVDLKGFDTHEDQLDAKNPLKGRQADLLHKVSQAITCFWDDINQMGRENDVSGLAFSEFGRRIKSNASRGTDHGSTQPILFFGADLAGGIIGKNPVIPDTVLGSDNLPLQYDFRAVYASILEKWMESTASEVKDILKGNFPRLNIYTV